MEKLISFLNKLHLLSGSLEADVRNSFRFTRKKKNEFLLHEDDVCRYCWYLKKGPTLAQSHRPARLAPALTIAHRSACAGHARPGTSCHAELVSTSQE